MKWILITPLLFLQFLSYTQEGKHEILSKTDKEVYLVGETIKIHIESRESFRLMTNGDCNSSILSPSFMKKINGEWKELEAQRQMCCGLPFSHPMKEIDYEMVADVPGHYKIVVFTDRGQVISNVFEVNDK